MSRNAVVTFALAAQPSPELNRHHKVYYSRAHINDYQRKAGQAESRLLYLFGNHREIRAYQDKHQLLCQQIRYNEVQARKPDYGCCAPNLYKVYREHRTVHIHPRRRESKSDQQIQKSLLQFPTEYYSSEQIAVTYQMTKKTICRSVP